MIIRAFVLLITTVLVVFWVIISARGTRKYAEYLEPIKKDERYPLSQIYGFGYGFLDLIRYSYSSHKDVQRITECKIIYGEQYGEYYYSVNMAQRFSFGYFFLVLFLAFYCLSGEDIMLIVAVFAAIASYFYVESLITRVVDEREEEIARQFADVVSKLTLLINAGMVMREAWSKVAESSTGLLYVEMRNAIQLMDNGTSEIDAYLSFGNRCNTKQMKKFTSLLVQNLTKGNRDLVNFLKQMSKESWHERKNFVKQKGEAAATKLLIPIAIMLVGILIMIVVPILADIM